MSHSVLYHFWSRDWFTLTSFKGLGQIINHFFWLYFINRVSLAHWTQRRDWAGLQQMDVSVNHTHSWCSLREILKWSMLQLKKKHVSYERLENKNGMDGNKTADLSVALFLCFQLSIIRRASCVQLLTSVAQLRISLPTLNIVHLINFFYISRILMLENVAVTTLRWYVEFRYVSVWSFAYSSYVLWFPSTS